MPGDPNGDIELAEAKTPEGAVHAALAGGKAAQGYGQVGGEPQVSVLADGWGPYLKRSMSAVLLGSSLNVLMLLTPLALVSESAGWGDGVTFALALLAIAPFAERLGYVTEQLALYTNETLGGLLNATFGNATELIISVFALNEGLLRVVQVSLLGSVLSNLLLVLGCALFFGGLKHDEQTFNKTSGTANSGLLMLASMSLLFPAVLNASAQETSDSELEMSRFVSVLLLLLYGAYLLFQLVTHRNLFEGQQDDDEEEVVLGFWGAIAWLTVITIFISVLSEVLVDAIKGAADDWGVSSIFIGAIVIPIVGNAAEHAAAVIFARRNKMDIALGVAVGSSTQIALFVVPMCVVMGWAMDKPLSLYFEAYETATMFAAVVMATFLIQDGRSNWLTGLCLITAYFVVAAGFWAHKDENLEG